MRLHEAIEKAKNGDTCAIPGLDGFIISKEAHRIISPLTDKPYVFCPRDFQRGDWRIIPAEPKVFTAEESYGEIALAGEDLEFYPFKIIYNFIMKNGRLERDLEVRPVVKAIQKYQNDDSIEFHESGIFEALENLKPLNDE